MQLRELARHSAVYGAGQILSRLTSVLLLPFYTRYLAPADYGVIAILDLGMQVLAILIGGGLGSAAARFHFDSDDARHQRGVWWTSLLMISAMATVIVGLTLSVRQPLAAATLGPEVPGGAQLWSLALLTLWLNTVSQVPTGYVIVRQWSGMAVVLSLITLLLNIGLNVYFVAGLQMGISGVLWGNLLTAAIGLLIRGAIILRYVGSGTVDRVLAGKLLRFGSPLIVTALLSTLTQQSDRLILNKYFSLEQVGIYSLAFMIGQGVNALVLVPFFSIFDVAIYDIAKRPDARQTYVLVFEYFVYGLLLVLFGICLFISPVLDILVPGEYSGVAPLVPIICLGFFFFSLHGHFRVPALLNKQTIDMVMPYASAAVVNIALNLAVVPRFGAFGAAWVSVATYAVFSLVGLHRYRRIDIFEYPLLRCSVILVALAFSYAGCEAVQGLAISSVWKIGIPVVVWSAWAFVLLRPMLRRLSPLTPLSADS